MDIRGIKWAHRLQFTLCGENFENLEYCFIPEVLTEEEAIVIEEEAVSQNNNPPTFTFEPEATFGLDSMYQEWMDL